MKKGQTSRRAGIQDFLMPVTDLYITQGSGGSYSHKGTMANDIRGAEVGVKYPYYAPCDCKLIWCLPSNGQGIWQSLEKVRFSNGNIDYATFCTCHDETFNAHVGQVVKQGVQLGNMGKAGNATGVHVHIEVAQHKYDMSNWKKNQYGIYCFPDETDTDDCFFIDDTNVLNGMGGSWKHLSDVPVAEDKYINLPEWIEERNIYRLSNKEQFATLKPKKFGGLSYKIYSRDGEYAEIQTNDYGRCYVKATDSTPITDVPTYEHGNY